MLLILELLLVLAELEAPVSANGARRSVGGAAAAVHVHGARVGVAGRDARHPARNHRVNQLLSQIYKWTYN